MSEKMPFTQLMTDSFNFGWKELWTVTKALLLPLIIMLIGLGIVAAGLVDFDVFSTLEEELEYADDVEEVVALFSGLFKVPFLTALAVFTLAGFILSIPMYGAYTNLFRYIGLGERPANWWLPRLDGPMWRTFIAYLIYGVFIYVIYGVSFWIAYLMNPEAFAVFNDFGATIDSEPELFMPFVSFVMTGFFFGFIGNIIVGTKLAPFPAASACENSLMLVNSWVRTKGHFWTILGAYILLMVAITMLSTVISLMSSLVESIATIFGSAGGIGGIILMIVLALTFVVSVVFQFFTMGVVVAFMGNIYKRLWDR